MKRTGYLTTLATAAVMAVAGCAASTTGAPAGSTPAATTAATPSAAPSATKLTDVDVAEITFMDASSVTWTDARRVPAKDNNETIEALPGPEHVHTAPIAPDATFFLPTDKLGAVTVDKDGLGAQPCTKAQFIVEANRNIYGPKIFFNSQGQITKIAARYHP